MKQNSEYSPKGHSLFYNNLFIFILLSVITVVFQWTNQMTPPVRDSGAFLYMGQQILDGKLPYLDMWDHKGPIVFYLNALGLYLANGKFIGVWFLQVLFTSISTYFCFKTIKKVFVHFEAVICSISMIVMLVHLGIGGNQTEQWALLFQTASLFYFISTFSSLKNKKRYLIIGLFAGFAFLLRQNLIGVWLGISVFLFLKYVYRKNKRDISKFIQVNSFMAIGFFIIILITLLYFYSKGIIEKYFDASFTYNFAYSESNLSTKIKSLFTGINLVQFTPIAFAFGIFYAFKSKKESSSDKKDILLLCTIVLFFEIFLSGLSNRNAPHYFITWLPAVSILTGASINYLFKLSVENKNDLSLRNMKIFVSIFVAIIISVPIYDYYENYKRLNSHEGKWYREKVVDLIKKNTFRKDYLLHWGMVGSMNFLTKLKSPTRFFYQYPLNTTNYASKELFFEFLRNLHDNVPKVIIDASNKERLPPLDKKRRNEWLKKIKDKDTYEPLPQNSDLFFRFVELNYTYVGNMGFMNLYFYNGKKLIPTIKK